MSLGDWILASFIGIIFCLGVYFGIRLFRWNKKDHEAMMARNEERKNQLEDVREGSNGEAGSDAGPDGSN